MDDGRNLYVGFVGCLAPHEEKQVMYNNVIYVRFWFGKVNMTKEEELKERKSHKRTVEMSILGAILDRDAIRPERYW